MLLIGILRFNVLGAGLEPATLRSSGECSKPTELPELIIDPLR